jgi:hypothetical protein
VLGEPEYSGKRPSSANCQIWLERIEELMPDPKDHTVHPLLIRPSNPFKKGIAWVLSRVVAEETCMCAATRRNGHLGSVWYWVLSERSPLLKLKLKDK